MRASKHSGRQSGAVSARALIAAGVAGSSFSPTAYQVGGHRRWSTSALALATATTIAFAPIAVNHQTPLHLPAVTAPSVALTADVSHLQDVIASVNEQLNSLDANITNLVGIPGQTLAGALHGAASLNSSFWQTLITAANGDKLIDSALRSLEQLTSGGLTELATSVSEANNALTLTTGELSTLLTSALTGSASTALAAFSGLAANPLSFSAWLSLIDAPFTIAGGVLSNAINAAENLGANTIAIGGTIVHGVTAQISNIVEAVNDLVSGVQGAVRNNLVDGLLTAVQGVVSAPLNAVLSLVDGGADAVTGVASDVVSVIAKTATHVSSVWLGDGTTSGAIQAAIHAIGTAPLDVESYARAVTTLARAAVSTVTGTARTIVTGLAPIPFTAAAAVVHTVAGTITSFTDGVAQIGAGLLTAVGVPSLISNTVYGMAGAFNAGVKLIAGAVAAGLNATAALLKAGTALTNLDAPLAATATTAKAAALTVNSTRAASTSSTSKPSPTEEANSPAPAAKSANESTHTAAATAATKPSPKHGASTRTEEQPDDTTTAVGPAPASSATAAPGSATATPGHTTGSAAPAATPRGSSSTGPKHDSAEGGTSGATKTGATESSASTAATSPSTGKHSRDGAKAARGGKSGETAHDSTR